MREADPLTDNFIGAVIDVQRASGPDNNGIHSAPMMKHDYCLIYAFTEPLVEGGHLIFD